MMLDRLAAEGAPYRDPVAAIDWRAADGDMPWLPPSLLGAGGLGVPADKWVGFSRVEFARLCAAGLWLEGMLISRVTEKGFLGMRADEARVMLQEVREESGHSLMFIEMINRARLANVPLLGETGLLTWVAHRLDPEGPEFWAMVYIGETVTDTFAVRALRSVRENNEAICPVAAQVLSLHHRDEARHIAAARVFLGNRLRRMSRSRHMLFATTLRFLLKRFLIATLYPTTESLRALGIDDADGAAAAFRACPQRRRLAQACAQPSLSLIERNGLIGEIP